MPALLHRLSVPRRFGRDAPDAGRDETEWATPRERAEPAATPRRVRARRPGPARLPEQRARIDANAIRVVDRRQRVANIGRVPAAAPSRAVRRCERSTSANEWRSRDSTGRSYAKRETSPHAPRVRGSRARHSMPLIRDRSHTAARAVGRRVDGGPPGGRSGSQAVSWCVRALRLAPGRRPRRRAGCDTSCGSSRGLAPHGRWNNWSGGAKGVAARRSEWGEEPASCGGSRGSAMNRTDGTAGASGARSVAIRARKLTRRKPPDGASRDRASADADRRPRCCCAASRNRRRARIRRGRRHRK